MNDNPEADRVLTPPSPCNISKPKVVLLKILGVTTPWNFARKTLVSYAQEHCKDYIDRNVDEEHMVRLAEQLVSQNGKQRTANFNCPLVRERGQTDVDTFKKDLGAYVSWCITNGMYKCGTPMSELLGFIWGEAFSNASVKAELYPEVFETIKSWKSQNIKVYTFSSGSIEGQRTWFENSTVGDISKYLDGHISSSVSMLDKFDTACYAKVSLITNEERNQILMLTNSTAEAKAATISGIPSCLVQRENNACINLEEAKFFTRISQLTELKFKKT